jgi:hypothetical protein
MASAAPEEHLRFQEDSKAIVAGLSGLETGAANDRSKGKEEDNAKAPGTMSEDTEASRNTLAGEELAENFRSLNQLGKGDLQLNAEEDIVLEGPLEALQS